jgi:N-methylhydantoinase A
MGYRIGIDIGGTFTDFAVLKGSELILHKNLSTPADRSIGVMTGLSIVAERQGLQLSDFLGQCDAIVHATTIADNTLIEMNGALTGLITTEGFRDEMEYRRGFKESIWDVRLPPPPQITPRRRRLTVPERVLFDGSVHKPLDEDAVRECCRRLKMQHVESVAISYLFSFVNPSHEKRTAEIVAEEMPGVHVSCSHQVLPRAPEYDRTSTTVVNAYIAPRVTSYLETLVSRLEEAGYLNQLMVMQASGGVMTQEYIEGSPIRVLSSGPAGGVMGSAHVGRAKGYPDLLCVDMGGTSYDVSVVLDGVAPADAAWNMHHRYLIGVPMVKVETLGAGGGSICHVNKGALEVGPASAGAEPGPICYGRGGERPTITDALVMLGILSADSEFAGGSFALRTAGIAEAFAGIGAQMGYGAEEAAFDSWRVVNANMTQAVRRSTAEKGIDPTRMIMLAYGGNGPVFAAVQAQELGIDRVLVPKASPAFSALGALVANPSIDEERSYIAPATALDVGKLRELWRELDQRAEKYFRDANFSRQQVFAKYQMKMRYPGQNWSLTFDIKTNQGAEDLSFVDDSLGARAIEAFNKRHMDEYGHVREGETPEVVGVRLSTYAETPAPRTTGGFTAPKAAAPVAKTRRANLGDGYQKTNVYRGADLRPGHQIVAPAIIEETFTTIVVYPGWSAQLDDAGDYQLTKLESRR